MNLKNPTIFANGWIVGISGFLTIGTSITTFFSNKYVAVSVLVCIILFLITAILMIYRALLRFSIINNPDEFESNSTFIKYSTNDGNIIDYEVYKHVQCKRLFKTEFDYQFKWSGSQRLTKNTLTSRIQEVKNVITHDDNGTFDKAILKLSNPLVYNEQCVIHFKCTLDDTNHISNTHVGVNVKYRIELIHIRVELKHKNDNFNALIVKTKLDTQIPGSNREVLANIPFDLSTKSFEYHFINPEVGYNYKIEWNR